jgi:hypothetical protein
LLQRNTIACANVGRCYITLRCKCFEQDDDEFRGHAKKIRNDGIIMKHLSLLSGIILLLLMGSARTEPARPGLQNCVAGVNSGQQKRCDEEASEQAKAQSGTTQLDGGWRLVRTKDPRGGADAIAVMHVVDSAKSDLALVGLSLRCGQGGVEVVLIVLEPLLRASHPTVILTTRSNRAEFEASVIQNGEAVLLPQAAASLAAGDWQQAAELTIEIATKPNPIRGIVPLGGLSAALHSLIPNCAVR